jgi:fibronectin-binding autotransporter adhesin
MKQRVTENRAVRHQHLKSTWIPRFGAGKWCIAAALILYLGIASSLAADVTLKTTDAAGTSSFTGSTNWSDGNPPSVGNAYFTGANAMRTTNYADPGGSITLTFGGDSLSIDAGGGRLSGKIGNNGTAGNASTGIYTANFILNGGQIDEGGGPRGNDVLVIDGTVTVNAASILSAAGAAGNNNANFETLEVVAPISGNAALQICGTNALGSGTGTVKLSAANPYSGTMTVPTSSAIASAVNRTLQLNHVDALANATLNLTSTSINPVSFTSLANTALFNVGALAGTSSQALSDTAASAVALSVGANNTSSSYSGSLTGNGGLIKVGTGTLTLSGANTYTGNTVISNGVLALSSSGSLLNSTNIIVASATFDVSSNVFTLVGGQNLLGSGTVNGPVSVASGASVYAGLDGSYGTNTFTTNLTFSSGASINLDVGTAYNGSNDRIVVGGNLLTTNTVFHIKAPSMSVNLDQADYILMTATGSLAGTLNATPIWDVQPLNAGHYTIAKNGNNIVLHYNASLQPSGYGSVSPNPAVRNQGVQITVTVTYSATPVSSVTVDATALGGSSSVQLISAGGGNYTNTVVVGSAIATGDQTLAAIITDSTSPTPLSTTTPGFTVTINAASKIWSGGGTDDNWSTDPNWQSGSAPGYTGDALTFGGNTRLTPDMNANYNVTGLTFAGPGGFVLGSSSGSILTLTGDITDNSSTMQTLNLSITNVGNIIHVSGNNNMAINGGIAGAGGLEDNVNDTLTLSGTNSFTGGINLNSGVLQIGGAGMLGGTNGNYAGNITNSALLQYSSSETQTLSGVVSWYGNVLKDGSGKLILGGNNTYFADTFISNGVLQVTGTLANDAGNDYVYNITDNGTLQWSSSAVQTLGGIISGDGGLIMDGSGTLNINGGNNTYSGATIVNGGTLAYNPSTVSYSTSVNSLVINGGGTVLVNAGSGTSLPVGSLTLNTNGVLNLNYDFSGGNPTIPAVAVSGSLSSPGTNVIQIRGYGAANTQFPLISYGTLSAGMNHFVLSPPSGMSGNLDNNTANHTIDLNVTGTYPETWIPLTADDPNNDSSFTNNVRWQDGNLPAAGNGYYTQGYTIRNPADANDYTFGGSALSIDQYSAINNSGAHFILKGGGGGVITVTNLILNGGLVDYANQRGDNTTKTLAGSITLNTGTTSYSGAATAEALNITASITGGGNLQIGGINVNAGHETGGVALYGTNTYTGSTTVATGVLLVNGPTPNTSVTVLTNATLRGTSSMGGSVTVQSGGTLAAGIAAGGTLSITLPTILSALTLNGPVSVSGTVLLRINRTNSPSSDGLIASTVTINPGATLTVNNIGSTNLVAGDTFTLFSTAVSGFSVTNLPALPNSNLAWTNKLAVDGTIAVYSTIVGPSGSEALTNSFNAASGVLSLSWPANKGWRLQMQTNSLAKGLGTNWVYVTDGTVSSTNISINAANSSVFYRLTYP